MEEFFSTDGEVRLYVCGVTPYDTTHLGHARTFVVFDVLRRYLQRRGYRVRCVQNVTDVDDPLFRRARDLGVHYQELAQYYTRVYQQDMAALNVLPPDHFPLASQEVPSMVEVIDGLVRRGVAYVSAGRVYFRTSAFPRYGSLSRLGREEMLALAQEAGEDPTDPHKEDPLDFLMWKPSGPQEPAWPSPWGDGRPGWHIECSSMAIKYLGPSLDIHGGGEDLIYPHHENEIAQSESYTGTTPYARFWVHAGMVRLDGVKMSKSLGNMVMVRDLLGRYSADAIRLYLLHFPYRQPLEYLTGAVEPFQVAAARMAEAVRDLDVGDAARSEGLVEQALAALDDDLDTPRTIGLLWEWADRAIWHRRRGEDWSRWAAAIREVSGVLGLRLDTQ